MGLYTIFFVDFRTFDTGNIIDIRKYLKNMKKYNINNDQVIKSAYGIIN